MYIKIQECKKQGMSRGAVAQKLELSWATVDHYWDMSMEDYELLAHYQFKSGLDKHQDIIIQWLQTLDDVSAAQIRDWLLEHYKEAYNERTVRDYVQRQRVKYNLPRKKKARDYNSVPELPPGQQLQSDFGEYWAIRQDMRRIKLYFVVFILAHSRYKYVIWQIRPFTAIDFTRSLESCFEEIGGIPLELVIDQDRLMVVDENYGDIIYTQEFERCKDRHRFIVWLCRKGDPESKGMVESGVKFIKYNFARHRLFTNIDQWSADSRDWLVRTGNGKVHAETKKIPAEVFLSEKARLKPVISFTSLEPCTTMVSTPVRKNNTIRYRSCRYSVPSGTYNRCPEVMVLEKEGLLEIYDNTGLLLDRVPLGISPGELVNNNNHRRDNTTKVQELLNEARKALGNTPEAETYLQRIQKARGRYIRDQLQLIVSVTQKYRSEIILQAVRACMECGSNSATDFRDFASHWFRQVTLDEVESIPVVKAISEIPSSRLKVVQVHQHDPSVYEELIRKGGR
ncbi:MAG: IS21 family transposase [Bacillota bacterium]|nr:IS21 family transposase [Bacillota bacterium]